MLGGFCDIWNASSGGAGNCSGSSSSRIEELSIMSLTLRRQTVSFMLRNLQRTLWPNGQRISQSRSSSSSSSSSSRDNPTKMRTRVAAKAALFSCISDELKRLLGSDTARRGVLSVFDACQNRVLNRRLTLVLFEGILKTLFPDKPLASIIQRDKAIHSSEF